MREIKFRAWDKAEGWMVNWGTLFETQLFWDGLHGKNAVLMQYTGLKDKNGVEIYEGDIVKAGIVLQGCDNPYVVKWDEEEATFLVQNRLYCKLDTEVIGNIYENAELLKS